MSTGRTIKLPENSLLDYELAKYLGLEIKEEDWTYYSSLDGVNPTRFTQPPMFTTNQNLKSYMLDKAEESGIEIMNKSSLEVIAKELLEGLKSK